MSNMRKEAKYEIVKRLESEQRDIRGKLNSNKYHHREYVRKQTILKRELAVLHDLIRSLI